MLGPRITRLVLAATAALALPGNGPAAPDNRKIVEDFARLFYVERDVKQAFETLSTFRPLWVTVTEPNLVQREARGRSNAVAL